jgi:hypothetical protein
MGLCALGSSKRDKMNKEKFLDSIAHIIMFPIVASFILLAILFIPAGILMWAFGRVSGNDKNRNF